VTFSQWEIVGVVMKGWRKGEKVAEKRKKR